MKTILLVLMVVFSAGAMAAGKGSTPSGSNRSGADGGGTNFGHCRGAGCFK